MRIDGHAHLVPRALLDQLLDGRFRLPALNVEREGSSCRIGFPDHPARRAVDRALYDAEERQTWLDRAGLDRQVIGPWIDLVGYSLPPDQGLDWARAYNEAMIEIAKAAPTFMPLATLPMQDGAAAALALEEAVKVGFRGCMIGTQPKGPGSVLDAPDLDPFWQAADRHRIAVFIHAVANSGDPRLQDYGLGNALGRVTDVAIAVARLLFAGHVTRYAGARIVLPIAGAALPFAIGRLRRGHELAPAESTDPMVGLQELWFDSVVHDVDVLRFVGERFGFNRLIMGSDSPFKMGDQQPLDIVRALSLPTAETGGIMGANVLRLLQVEAETRPPVGPMP